MKEIELKPQIDNRIDLFNQKKTINSDFDLISFNQNNLSHLNTTNGMLIQSEIPDVDEYVQMQKDIRQEKNQREAIRDAYGDLRIKSMQQVQINDNL